MILDHLEVSKLMNHCYVIFFLFGKGQELVTPELMKELYHTLFQKKIQNDLQKQKLKVYFKRIEGIRAKKKEEYN